MTKPNASAAQIAKANRLRKTRDRLKLELAENLGAQVALTLEMREDGLSYDEIARAFGVSHVQIWKRVNSPRGAA